MADTTFDILEYLQLGHLDQPTKNKILPQIWVDVATFILNKFLDTLSDPQLDEVEGQLPLLKTHQDVFALIHRYQPDFEEQKQSYLAEYKAQFQVEKVGGGSKV